MSAVDGVVCDQRCVYKRHHSVAFLAIWLTMSTGWLATDRQLVVVQLAVALED
jgi:hypothetical protein